MASFYEGNCCEENSAEEVKMGTNKSLMKRFDAVVFDLLKVTPEELARQLTLLDFPIFRRIKPEEISCCGWTKKEKSKLSPNVVAMTKRFNHTSFWVIREILSANSLKIRVERIIHFIKIAKKLMELNNLHSLMAVIQSLTSSSIYRLTQTWALVPKSHRSTFERLHSLVKEDENRKSLRSHMNHIRLPCIPYLGLYLSDMMYINTAHPDTGGMESHERSNKMNNILRVISEFQKSDYADLEEKPHIKNYLNSVKYIEELQRFLEEDNYKLSLKLEPISSPHTEGSKHEDTSLKSDHHLAPPSLQNKFTPGHRKSRSLGKEFYCGQINSRVRSENVKIQKRQSLGVKQIKVKSWNCTPSNHSNSSPQHHLDDHGSGSLPRSKLAPPSVSLLDDSILSNSTPLCSSTTKSSVGNTSSMTSSRSNSGSEFSEHDDSITWLTDRKSDAGGSCQFEGVLKRKCVLKKGKKPPINSWTKYWAVLSRGQIFFFSSKSLGSSLERHQFKTTPSKILNIIGWMVLPSTEKPDSFQLSNPNNGTIYKFLCDSEEVTDVWISNLKDGVKENSKPERDLIDLGDR